MAKQTALDLKRKEVREEILAMKEKIPTAILLNYLGKAFKKQSLGYWLSNFIVLNVIALVSWLVIGLALDELLSNQYLWIPGIIAVEEGVSTIFLAHIITLSVFDDITNNIITKINNSEDLDKVTQWFRASWFKRNVFSLIVVWVFAWLSLGPIGFSIVYHNFAGFGFLLTSVIVGSFVGMSFYTVVWVTWLVLNLKNYQYELNAFSPADSEIISNITDMLTKCIYSFAAFFACITLINTSNLIDSLMRVLFSLPFLLISWISIIVQFFVTRSTIAKIVNDAKWKTLNKIQKKINVIESTGDLSEKETAEKFMRLADIHRQIMASRTNIFDLKSFSTLFSQLMLPLLGLLLGNLDRILALLPR